METAKWHRESAEAYMPDYIAQDNAHAEKLLGQIKEQLRVLTNLIREYEDKRNHVWYGSY